MPKVGIITCAWRGGEFLREAIESARAQRFTDFEMLVLDDANREATRELVMSFRDARVRYVANQERLGVAGNHLRALELTDTPLVGFLNEDDRWLPTFLEKLVAGLESEPAAAQGAAA